MKTTGTLFFGVRVHRVEIVRNVPLPQLVTLSDVSSDSQNEGTAQVASPTPPPPTEGLGLEASSSGSSPQ